MYRILSFTEMEPITMVEDMGAKIYVVRLRPWPAIAGEQLDKIGETLTKMERGI